MVLGSENGFGFHLKKCTLSAENQSRIPSGLRSKIFPSLAMLRLMVRYPRLSSNSTSST